MADPTRSISSSCLCRKADRLDGGAGFSADDHSVSGGVAFARVTTYGGDVIVKLGGDPLTDLTDLGHDGIR